MATKNVPGFRHLSGRTVYVTCSGYLYGIDGPNTAYSSRDIQTVTVDGEVTVDALFFGDITVGVGYTLEIDTLPVSMEVQAASRGTVKSVNKVFTRSNGSGVLQAGPTTDKLVDMTIQRTETGEIPPMVEIPVLGDWNGDARLVFRHSDPEPLMMHSLVIDVTTGG